MAMFLFTARSPEGKTIIDRIDGATLSAARYKLETQGFSEISFHTDDMERHMVAAMIEPTEVPPSEVLSPEKELEARRGGGVIREVWAAWKLNSVFWVPLAIWNGFTLWEGQPFGVWDWVGFGLSAVFLLYFFWLALPAVAYQRLLEAGVWFRWNEVRRWVRFIRVLKRIGFVPIPELELDFRVAWGMAAEGNLDEALALVQKHENGKAGRFMYLSRLSGLYEAAGRYDQMTQCRKEAVECGTGNPAEKLDLALGLLRRHRNPEGARAILEELGQHEGGDLVVLFLLYCEGLLAIEESNWKDADEKLKATMNAAATYANNVLVKGMLSDIKAYRAIALANLGHAEEARRLIRDAEPLLQARRDTVLLERCVRSLPVA